ncbi:hypothetical protein M404DRAFT_1004138 [Pisolithus tinctorius Marx 270]|uniref:Uncharacterized protein n=1 Tax=Pisolithus tinctorius Marx 270 TaxID=870435 RepID=A0A0C3JRV7_PISTI|nr:hypothetical protein M404DRAFT_1004138 [Pisolithus tinctorius Marx 270]
MKQTNLRRLVSPKGESCRPSTVFVKLNNESQDASAVSAVRNTPEEPPDFNSGRFGRM